MQDVSHAIRQNTLAKLTRRARLETSQVVLEPSDVNDVEMVRRLIKQENVRLEQHRTRKSKLHLPTTGQAADGLLLTLLRESDGRERFDDLLLIRLDAGVRQDERQNRRIRLGAVDVVLDVERANLIRRREAFDLSANGYTQLTSVRFSK